MIDTADDANQSRQPDGIASQHGGFDHSHPILAVYAIAHNARTFANATAVVCDDRRLTWAELDTRVNQVSNFLLDLGLQRGEKVGLLLENSIEFLECFWGILGAGCVVVPVNTLLDDAALGRVLDVSDASVLIADPTTVTQAQRTLTSLRQLRAEGLFCFGEVPDGWRSATDLIASASDTRPAIPIGADDPMSVMYTSGSTGVPKGIEHTHGSRMLYPLGFGMGLKVDRYSVAGCPTPMHASGSWITIFPVMYRGGTVVLMRKFTPDGFLELIEREGITHTFLVPTMYIGILRSAALQSRDVSSVQVLLTSGQTMASATRTELCSRFSEAGLYESYGLTEGSVTLRIPEDDRRGKSESVGKPLLLDEVRIIDLNNGRELETGQSGEIVMFGPGMMKGYYNDPERTRSATWISADGRAFLRTGDIGHLDDDGFLYVSGRLKDMIKSGGINIYAVDIEDVFMKHPAVREAAAIGVAHEKWVETPVLVAVLAADTDVEPDDVRQWGNEKLSRYQRVAAVVIVDELPRATYGKVHKDRLREQYRDLFITPTSRGRQE